MLQTLQDRYIQLTGWTESRSHESRMRHFFSKLKQQQSTSRKVIYGGKYDRNNLDTLSEILWSWSRSKRDEGIPSIDLNASRIENVLNSSEYDKFKPSKKIYRFIRDSYDVSLPQEIKQQVGPLVRELEPQVLYACFTLGCEGNARDYSHGRSCYWGEYSAAKDIITASGGGSLRFYDLEGNLVGRSWFVPHNTSDFSNGIILFNAYGEGDLQHIKTQGQLASQALGVANLKVSIDYNPNGNLVYFNRAENCEFIGTIKTPISRFPEIKLMFSAPKNGEWQYSSRFDTCEECGNYGYSNDFYSSEGLNLCYDCHSERYTYVEQGEKRGMYLSHGEVISVNTRFRSSRFDREGYWVTHTYWINDSDIVNYKGTYYLRTAIVHDVYGDIHIKNSDSYYTFNGSIYPSDTEEEIQPGNSWFISPPQGEQVSYAFG